MDTLGKFKTNFLKDRSSFKIGFNNRSPLSNLQGKLDGSLPTVSRTPPKLKSTIGKDGGSILAQDDGRLEAAEMVGEAISEAGANIQKSIEEGIFNKITKNLPEHFANWKKANPDKSEDEYNKQFREHIDVYTEWFKKQQEKNKE